MKEKYSQYPEQIPNHIQDAIFSQHRWLGEGSLFLEYKTTNEEIQTLEDKHRSQAICIIEDVTNTDAQKETPDICSWDSYKSLWEKKDYIDSLEVIVLNHYIEPSGNNEHCDTTGIAFDKTNSIVMYWTDAYWCRLGSEIYELYPDMHWGTP